jgi:hypothetical protein
MIELQCSKATEAPPNASLERACVGDKVPSSYISAPRGAQLNR